MPLFEFVEDKAFEGMGAVAVIGLTCRYSAAPMFRLNGRWSVVVHLPPEPGESKAVIA